MMPMWIFSSPSDPDRKGPPYRVDLDYVHEDRAVRCTLSMHMDEAPDLKRLQEMGFAMTHMGLVPFASQKETEGK